MKRVISVLLGLSCIASASAVKVGQTWAEVEAELGKPINKLDAPGRSIGRWADVEVIFVGGRVESMVQRDLAAEAASEARRKEETEKLRRMREEIENEKRRREEEMLTGAENHLERERQAEIAKIAALEAQLEAARKRLKRLNEKTEEQNREDSLSRAELLRKEIPLLRAEIQRTLSMGEVEKASRLQRELLVKETELKTLTRANP
jgi:hypothetical protein